MNVPRFATLIAPLMRVPPSRQLLQKRAYQSLEKQQTALRQFAFERLTECEPYVLREAA